MVFLIVAIYSHQVIVNILKEKSLGTYIMIYDFHFRQMVNVCKLKGKVVPSVLQSVQRKNDKNVALQRGSEAERGEVSEPASVCVYACCNEFTLWH